MERPVRASFTEGNAAIITQTIPNLNLTEMPL